MKASFEPLQMIRPVNLRRSCRKATKLKSIKGTCKFYWWSLQNSK